LTQTTLQTNLSRAEETLSLLIAQKTLPGDNEAFNRFYEVLSGAFPNAFKAAEIQRVSTGAMLLLFRGSHSLQPLLFTGHADVAPVSKETEEQWDFPAFSGVVADGYVWGRGAMDMKGHVAALFEAVEEMLESGFVFKRDIWVAISGDEEIRGTDAQTMFRILKAQGVRPAFVLDEGMGVIQGQWGIKKPLAMIGIGEKGHANLHLNAGSKGGHGAYPPKSTALEKVIRATTLMTSLPLGLKHLSPALVQMLKALAPCQKGLAKFAFWHPKLCKWYITNLLDETPFGRAFLMTTVAVTKAQGSTAANSLPEAASVTLNCRINQGDTVEKLKKRAEIRIANHDVTLTCTAPADPSRVSPAKGPAWDALAIAVSVHFPDAIPVPCLILGASDARRYEGLSDHVYRFSPFELSMEEQAAKHGVNERLSLSNLEKGIAFFRQMLGA
jgi:Acetylornithine deacetylase/Succinyl-diaminopimelate desuccinylase and related deacylases